MFLGVLVGFEQQVDQTGDSSSIPQRGLVLWAQGQVADQANHSLQAAHEIIFRIKLKKRVFAVKLFLQAYNLIGLHLSQYYPSTLHSLP